MTMTHRKLVELHASQVIVALFPFSSFSLAYLFLETDVWMLKYRTNIAPTEDWVDRHNDLETRLCNQQATFFSYLLTDAKPYFTIRFANLFLKCCLLWKENRNHYNSGRAVETLSLIDISLGNIYRKSSISTNWFNKNVSIFSSREQ